MSSPVYGYPACEHDVLLGALTPPLRAGFSILRLVGDHDEWLDAEAAALYLGLPAGTVDRLLRDGLLDGRRYPVQVRRDALDACIERCRIGAGTLPFASHSTGRGGEPPLTAKGLPNRRYGPRYGSSGLQGVGGGGRRQLEGRSPTLVSYTR